MTSLRPKIDETFCKGCNICIAICPVKVYEEGRTASGRGFVVPTVKNPEKCMDGHRQKGEKKKCEMCVYVCPDQAIGWESE